MVDIARQLYPLLFVTERVEFYDIEAKDKIASVEEKVCHEEMADNDGEVEKFTEDEADEIVSVPATQKYDNSSYIEH